MNHDEYGLFVAQNAFDTPDFMGWFASKEEAYQYVADELKATYEEESDFNFWSGFLVIYTDIYNVRTELIDEHILDNMFLQ